MAMPALVAHGLLHAGGEIFKPLVNYVKMGGDIIAPTELVAPERVMDLHRKGWVSDEILRKTCGLGGVQLDLSQTADVVDETNLESTRKWGWNREYYAGQELPGVKEYLVISNRYLLGDPQVAGSLQRWGYIDPALRERVTNLRYEIPSSSDLVRFSVRHVFEPDLIDKLKYNEEFQPILDIWHRFQGLNYPIFTGPFEKQINEYEISIGLPAGALVAEYFKRDIADPTWAQAFWWSHWVLPSPSQGYEAMFRLRKGRDESFDPPEAVGINFTYEDLKLLLRANDYPPYYRPMLAAIAHRLPGIRFIRSFRATDVYQFKDLVEWAKRWGYSDRDATDIATNIERTVQEAKNKKKSCSGCAAIKRYYETGIITYEQAIEYFKGFGLSADDAQTEAAFMRLDVMEKRSRQVIAVLRRRYLTGDLSEDEARQALLGYGIMSIRTEEYLNDWALERSTNLRHVQAAKLVKWTCDGLIGVDDLVRRLTNLQYPPEDQAGMVAEATYCAGQLAARAAAKEAALERRTQADLKRAQTEAARVIKEAQRALAAHGSPAQLRRWYCEGHVSQAEVCQRLNFLGWPDADIFRLLNDCTAKEAKGGEPPKPSPSCK